MWFLKNAFIKVVYFDALVVAIFWRKLSFVFNKLNFWELMKFIPLINFKNFYLLWLKKTTKKRFKEWLTNLCIVKNLTPRSQCLMPPDLHLFAINFLYMFLYISHILRIYFLVILNPNEMIFFSLQGFAFSIKRLCFFFMYQREFFKFLNLRVYFLWRHLKAWEMSSRSSRIWRNS